MTEGADPPNPPAPTDARTERTIALLRRMYLRFLAEQPQEQDRPAS